MSPVTAPPTDRRALLTAPVDLAATAVAGLLGLVLAGGWVVAGLDRPVHDRLLDIRTGWLTALMKVVTELGSPVAMVVLAAVATAVLWRRSGHLVLALLPVSVAAASTAAELALKTIVGRARPPTSQMLVPESGYGFPSGHATVSAGLLICLALLAWALVGARWARLLRVVALVDVALIGLSRLYLGVHWSSDVLAGWAIGALAAVAVIFAAGRLVDRLGSAPLGTRRDPHQIR